MVTFHEIGQKVVGVSVLLGGVRVLQSGLDVHITWKLYSVVIFSHNGIACGSILKGDSDPCPDCGYRIVSNLKA